jgi:deoxyribonuclease V
VSVRQLHLWDTSPTEAAAIQLRLGDRVIAEDALGSVRSVAGIDVGFEDGGKVARAAVVVLGFPGLEVLEQILARRASSFPYIPGLLSFREIPAVLDAFERLRFNPDLILCDGQGLAHPRRFGLACHLGVLTDLPTIGVAKTRLVGTHTEPGLARGDWAPLWDAGSVIGAVLRTRSQVKPLFVSIGHRIGLDTAIGYVLACSPRFRLPETTRRAHRLASG